MSTNKTLDKIRRDANLIAGENPNFAVSTLAKQVVALCNHIQSLEEKMQSELTEDGKSLPEKNSGRI